MKQLTDSQLRLIVSAFGQWYSIHTRVIVLKNKLRNTWDVIFIAGK